jgi:hypothetical protein
MKISEKPEYPIAGVPSKVKASASGSLRGIAKHILRGAIDKTTDHLSPLRMIPSPKDDPVTYRLLPLSAALLLAGCGDESLKYSIDNPTDATIALDIDGTSYQIPAHDAKDVVLKPGEHSMKGATVGDLKFIVYVTGKPGLINPTLGDYVITQEAYVTDESKMKNFGAIKSKIVLDGVTFSGPFQHTHSLFIDGGWSFGVKENFPDSLTGHDAGNGGNIFTKIFTKKDFIAYYERRYDAPDYFAKNRPADPPAPEVRKAEPPAPLPTIDAPEYESQTGPLREVCAKYLKATEPSEQKALHKSYFDASMAYTQATASLAMKAPPGVGEQSNQFVFATGAVMGASALIER